MTSSLIFLSDNQIDLKFDPIEFEHLVIDVVNGKISKKSISLFFKKTSL